MARLQILEKPAYFALKMASVPIGWLGNLLKAIFFLRLNSLLFTCGASESLWRPCCLIHLISLSYYLYLFSTVLSMYATIGIWCPKMSVENATNPRCLYVSIVPQCNWKARLSHKIDKVWRTMALFDVTLDIKTVTLQMMIWK